MSAIAAYPDKLGIGIDEDTCALFDEATSFQVIGKGTVTIIDPTEMGYTNHPDVGTTDMGAVVDASKVALRALNASMATLLARRARGVTAQGRHDGSHSCASQAAGVIGTPTRIGHR